MTTKRGSKKSSRDGKSTRAPGLLSALQDDTEEVTFFSIFCDSIYCIFFFKKKNKQKKNPKKIKNQRVLCYPRVKWILIIPFITENIEVYRITGINFVNKSRLMIFW